MAARIRIIKHEAVPQCGSFDDRAGDRQNGHRRCRCDDRRRLVRRAMGWLVLAASASGRSWLARPPLCEEPRVYAAFRGMQFAAIVAAMAVDPDQFGGQGPNLPLRWWCGTIGRMHWHMRPRWS